MLKSLVKKQFYEIFRTYFVNTKTGKARSKAGIVGMFVFFALLMLFLCGTFFGLSYMLGSVMFFSGHKWLYFSIMGILAVLLGTFGSIFNTYSLLYLSKDNDLLFSMPIPPSKILVSRIVPVFGLSFLYSAIVWLPAVVFNVIAGEVTALSLINGILIEFIIAMFVTALTCGLGYIVAVISTKIKSKSFVTVLLSVLFIVVYYFLSYNSSALFNSITENSEKIGEGIKTWGSLFYWLGSAADGDLVSMIIFALVVSALFFACMIILSKTYLKTVTKNASKKTVATKQKEEKVKSPRASLLSRELKRFTSSTTYMLNCGFGILMLPIVVVLLAIKIDDLYMMLDLLVQEIPTIAGCIPLLVATVICLFVGFNLISTPSISLEGKNLWIIKSLPIKASDVLEAKLNLHILLNSIPAVVAIVVSQILVGTQIVSIVLSVTYVVTFIWLSGSFGLMIGLKNPNFDWTTETMPIKQSVNVLFSMLFGWLVPIISFAAYFLVADIFTVEIYLAVMTGIFLLLSLAFSRYFKTKGSKLFEAF